MAAVQHCTVHLNLVCALSRALSVIDKQLK